MTALAERARVAADRIEAAERRGLHAVLAFDRNVLLEQATKLDAAPTDGALTGLVIGVKDNIATLEYPTTCGSRILEGYRSPYEATAIKRLKRAGALIACKTNLDEFAMGSSTEHSAFGRTQHPEQPDLVPGGSSGGSAALVASGGADAALGSETGGSVRQPASFCGIVGIKPTYGRVSRYGLVAFGSSLDQIGMFGRDVRTAGRVLCAISGRDPNDATSADRPPLEFPEIPNDLLGFTIGVPKEYFPEDLDAGVRAACDRAIAHLRKAGAKIKQVSLPHTGLAIPTYYILAPAEASSNLARYDGVRYGPRYAPGEGDVQAMYRATRGVGFGPEVRRRIIVGTYVLSAGYYDAYYRKALRARWLIARDFDSVFAGGVDLLFTPSTPTTAFRAGDKLEDPVAMYLADVFSCPANLAWVTALSVPVGRSDGLPVGGQFIAPQFGEARMLQAASVLEALVDRAAEAR
ncbi:MAG TPA: Asp-tRNA(Asn)/Glu-tRNA(Gln) amidotransferase subunit GatA [Gemmatimonadales bacterium]|nr:Asp-tRNA(Asn)/Glu-tRNA(Gln) amidotransferase subunit GatA [Gemmatimonadales bacterium]